MFTVYEGIQTKMAELNDEPASDEVPEIPGQISTAYGTSGTKYIYVVATNQVHTFRPDPA